MASHARRIRQWAPLTALVLGVVACAIGARLGYPHSWWFFAAGVAATGVLVLIVYLRRTRVRPRRS